jgi:hypothetical protein
MWSWNMLMYETFKLAFFCNLMLWLIVNTWRIAPSVCIQYMLTCTYIYIYTHTHTHTHPCWTMPFLFISRHVFCYLLSLGSTQFCFQCADSNFYRRSIFEAAPIEQCKMYSDGQYDVSMLAYLNIPTRRYKLWFLQDKTFGVPELQILF